MPFDWADYLSFARTLAKASDDASRRSAISRAYYACYGIATSYALSRDFPHSVVTHDRVWGWYRQLDDPIGSDINVLGKRIKDRRLAADYHAHDDIIATQARIVCSWADELVALLQALPDDLESLELDISPER